ncbi:hypothetical protein Y717_04120 [Streptomyces scopuliridis RB72]|uniref:Uncharacterized protein n=1 Tax=Streptomyces scopuliridis RB72 TaxID=1440053 RepID=A0A2T7T8D0_9ACTN|nr:hypothetical protein Y717_04120 [Streptomyces scopuliridis RB72]
MSDSQSLIQSRHWALSQRRLRAHHLALGVPAYEQRVQGRVVQLLARSRQSYPAVAVECAQQRAHQRIGRRPAQVPPSRDGLDEGLFVRVED